MGILRRIKNRLPIVGGSDDKRPADTYTPPPRAAAPPPPPPAPAKSAEEVHAEIDAVVKGNPIVIYMKGTPNAPQCGFSAAVVEIFDGLGVPYEARNALESSETRQGIKDYSDWPTIPQIFLGGEFIGGCDIVREMHASGELKTEVDKLFAG